MRRPGFLSDESSRTTAARASVKSVFAAAKAAFDRVAAAVRARFADAEPEISAITGKPLTHLDGGLTSGRRGFASAIVLHAVIISALLFGWFAVEEIAEESGMDLPGLVFVVEAGPGGGGGGGGDESEEPPAPLQLEGEDAALVAVETATDPEELVYDDPEIEDVEVEPPTEDALNAPFETNAPDPEMLAGLIRDASEALRDGRAGSGVGGGGGNGAGGGIGEGAGDGIGEGTGGGFGGGAYRIGSGVEPPQLRRRVTPEYTDDALARKIEGKVILEVVILKNGRIGPARVLRSLDRGLDDKAIAAVRQWTFLPGRFRGEPVDVLAEIEVEFRLL